MATSEQSGTSGPLTRPAGHFCYDDKVFNDPIHGHIRLHPLLVKIIDTPQFQRLRYIKQLGGCYFVYPGASHNRFEHSIGVAHLAGKLIESLQKEHQNDKELMDLMDKQTVLCVKIAGLCHDLGHGPLSHLWEKQFLKKQKKKKWEHEKASEEMLDHLIGQNDLMAEFEKYELTRTDIEFIKKLINPEEYTNSDNWPYDDKLKEKSFLFEIVANRRCAVDVDKWDYFKRDCHHLGMACSFDINRAMEFVRVIEVDRLRQICFREKELGNMYQMFHTRLSLHRAAYQHKTSNAVECMLSDALALADEHLTICGEDKDGKQFEYKMSKCVDNMTVYTNLTDSVIHQILVSTSKDLQKSKELLMRIQKRDLYRLIGSINPSLNLEPNNVAKEIAGCSDELTEDCLEIDVVYFNFGMKEKNPVDQIRFYRKDDPNIAFPIRESSHSIMFQQKFEEKIIRVYCKSADKVKEAKSCYEKWTKRNPKQNQPDNHPLDGDAAILEPPEKHQKIQQ